ncbi:MAG: hypothetical protein LBP19_10185, partial [Treponema sp.]|nr:hypothetical protein [Treponema sp.]
RSARAGPRRIPAAVLLGVLCHDGLSRLDEVVPSAALRDRRHAAEVCRWNGVAKTGAKPRSAPPAGGVIPACGSARKPPCEAAF